MCGIAGNLGISKDPELSFKIATNVFRELEARGKDAAGFWGTNQVNDVIFHKQPIRSSELIRTKKWGEVNEFNPNLLLLHARAASKDVGIPSENSNNHPFTNEDKSLCLIHNGRIPEFDLLKKAFPVFSDCDSEILLRIIEAAENRMRGIERIFSFINHGHMAVALGEMMIDSRHLWLFRNRHRLLCAIDLQEFLGQIWFCSTIEIWEKATYGLIKKQRYTTIPSKEVWHLQCDEDNKKQFQRFKVTFDPKLDDIYKILGDMQLLISRESDKETIGNMVRLEINRMLNVDK